MYVDDNKYEVYVTNRYNQSSIIENTDFKHYWSVRTGKKTKGTNHLNHHFNNLEEWIKIRKNERSLSYN